uniref:C2H2-type domain-containing protein n=1 Tax=Ditylenchus dipsaci TaxID=166011 RepID=A0A915DK23_9BILA
MSTRLSNLTNHVRRHAAMKQYQCKHCSYSHNEMAKVRLHMHHNHGDFNSQPNDALCYEMQLQWGLLMEQCFPEHANRFGPSATVLCQSKDSQKFVQEDSTYTCVDCGEMVEGSKLVDHLREAHKNDCVPYACSECDYQSSTQWKVRLHISVKHAERAADIPVNALAAGTNYVLFLHRFFPEIPGEEDEERMVAQLRHNSDKRFDNTSTEDNSASEEAMEPSLDETTTCTMCDGSLLSCNPLSNLLVHAKRHYVIKQFRCPECTHSCVDISSMRMHISIKHPEAESVKPIDLISEDLKVAWLDTIKKCFPHLQHRIESYHFQHEDYSSNTNSSKQNNEVENDSEAGGTPSMFDAQFDDNTAVSKIRPPKRQLPAEQEIELKRQTNGSSRSSSPALLRNTRSRLIDGSAKEESNGHARHSRRK